MAKQSAAKKNLREEPIVAQKESASEGSIDWGHVDLLSGELDLHLARTTLSTVPLGEQLKAHQEQIRNLDTLIGGTYIPYDHLGFLTQDLTPKLTTALIEEREALKEFRTFQINNATEALGLHEKISDQIRAIQALIGKPVDSVTDRATKRDITAQLPALEKQRDEIHLSNPDAFRAIGLQQVYSYIESLQRGERIIEMPYVIKKKEEINKALEQRGIAFIHGETGAGKTEIARQIAIERSGQEPIVLRGYPGMNSGEMFVSKKLASTKTSAPHQIPDLIESEIKRYRDLHPEKNSKELKDAEKQIIENVRSQSRTTVTEYVLGAVYEALSTGRVLIIDEGNYIPAELLAKMNDILTKEKGEMICAQEMGSALLEVKRKEILMTGNLDFDSVEKRYMGRVSLDPAFKDRVPCIEYDYLPQAIEGGIDNCPFSEKQQFAIALVTALQSQSLSMDEDGLVTGVRPDIFNEQSTYAPQVKGPGDLGALLLPEDFIDDLWRLAKFASVTQQVFSRRLGINDAFSFKDGGAPINLKTDKAITPRGLIAITESWAREGFNGSLSEKIYELFIAPTPDPRQRAYFFQQAKQHEFFKGADWKVQERRNDADRLSHFSVTAPAHESAAPLKLFRTTEILTALFGPEPERVDYPTRSESREQETEDLKKEAQLVAALNRLAEVMSQAAALAKEYPILIWKFSDEKKAMIRSWGDSEVALQYLLSKGKAGRMQMIGEATRILASFSKPD